MHFPYIGNHVMFLETIKYFQQNLGTLASNLTGSEKLAIQTECQKFLNKDENLSKKFNVLTEKDQAWVLDYLSTGKGKIPCEMITRYDSLDTIPEDGNFFLPYFYSNIKDDKITNEEYENVKKFYQTMKLKDFGELNKTYNFQDTIVLCEIFEQRSEQLQKLFKYNPRKCNSTS